MDANHELTQEECPICGFNQRNNNFKEKCENCGARTWGFGWYLLQNEIRTLWLSIAIIVLALILFAGLFYCMHNQINELENTISTNSIQSFITSMKQVVLW